MHFTKFNRTESLQDKTVQRQLHDWQKGNRVKTGEVFFLFCFFVRHSGEWEKRIKENSQKYEGTTPKTKGQSLVHTPTVKSRSVTNVTVTFEQQRKVKNGGDAAEGTLRQKDKKKNKTRGNVWQKSNELNRHRNIWTWRTHGKKTTTTRRRLA